MGNNCGIFEFLPTTFGIHNSIIGINGFAGLERSPTCCGNTWTLSTSSLVNNILKSKFFVSSQQFPEDLRIKLCNFRFLIPESPRWLLSIGKIQEAKMVLEKAAKFNNRTYTEDFDKILTSHITNNKRENPSVLMLFKGYLLKRTFCLFVAWFSMSIAYYGLVLNIGKFNLGNLHVTSIILAAVEIPAIALSIPILFKTGRRTPVFASMIVCGLACIASELFSVSLGNTWVIISCLMIGKFTISATNVMLPIYTAELYPTVIRNLGVGATQVAAGLALICIPYLWDLVSHAITINDLLIP